MKCPKCKESSLKKSSTYIEMTLCFNKNCDWYLKDDISVLRKENNYDDDGFLFSRKPFIEMYQQLIFNSYLEFNNSLLQLGLFIIDFLNKQNRHFYVVFSKEEEMNQMLRIIKRDKVVNNNSFLVEKELKYFDFHKSHNFLLIKIAPDSNHLDKLKKVVESVYEIC